MKVKKHRFFNSDRRSVRAIMIFGIVMMIMAPISMAQHPGSSAQEGVSTAPPRIMIDTKAEGLKERVTLDLRNIEISEALKFLAMKGSLNLVIGKNVAGRVSLYLTDVSVADVLEIILLSNNLAIAKQGEIYNVMSETEFQALYGKRFSDLRIAKVFKLRYAVPNQIFTVLSAIKSDIGKVVVDEDSATLILMDLPEKIQEMEKVIYEMEKGQNLRIFQLRYAEAEKVEVSLKERLDALKLGTVKADERSNSLVVSALPKRMDEIERIVRALDEKTREVLIEAKIVKVTLSDDFDMGINWQRLFRDTDNAFRVAKYRPILTGTFKPTLTNYGRLQIGNVSTDETSATIDYLSTVGQTKVLASPRLAVINKQSARIMIGTREAFVTTTTTTGQTTSTTAENVTFVDVGISLEVTPIINDDGYVTMKIKPEISSVARTLITPTQNAIPIVDTTLSETTVMVKDGTTIIIGGLRKNEKVKTVKKTPILGDIPLVGALFRNTSEQLEKIELVIFLTPNVVSGDMTFTDRQIADKTLKPFKTY
ncbi:MAG: type II secretion system protein GspD [Candidatus Omnitrophica bacterium]|nr:type II secretion system protein GspD [Candidatus Omnitrophota bacterium]